MNRGTGLQRLAALFAAGLLLFDVPLLQLWLVHPALLFAVWALLLAALAALMEGRDD